MDMDHTEQGYVVSTYLHYEIDDDDPEKVIRELCPDKLLCKELVKDDNWTLLLEGRRVFYTAPPPGMALAVRAEGEECFRIWLLNPTESDVLLELPRTVEAGYEWRFLRMEGLKHESRRNEENHEAQIEV